MARTAHRRPSRLVRIIHAHSRLLLSVAAGLLTFLALVYGFDLEKLRSGLIGWIVGIVLYLAIAFIVINRFDITHVRRRASSEDEGGVLVLVLTVIAAVASIAAIFAQLEALSAAGAASMGLHFALAIVTILLSWTFIQVIFAFHYAHEFYGEGRDGISGGLQFPEDDKPDYWDFVYFALVLGMTFQVSDVQITSKLIRRLAAAHGFVSFIFNVSIVAMFVNIGGSILNK